MVFCLVAGLTLMRIAKLSRQQFAIITTALARLFAEKEIIEEEERLRFAAFAIELFDRGVGTADDLSAELLKLCCASPDGLSQAGDKMAESRSKS